MSGGTRCAYGPEGIRCTKPGYKGGKYCRAHTPKTPKTAKVGCPSCQGIGWFYDDAIPTCCADCHGRGKVEIKLVTVKR